MEGVLPGEFFDVDEAAGFFGVVNAAGGFADLLADGEGAGGVVAQVGAVDFEPEAFGALAEGEDFGFG